MRATTEAGRPRVAWTDAAHRALRRIPTWTIYLAGFGWLAWLFALAATGGLGVEPVKALEERYGLLALQLLVAGLALTPLRRFFGLNLIRFRRAIGMMAFWCLCAHLLVWLVLDLQSPAMAWADIVKRPFITVGMAALLLLVPLALTSTDRAIRRLGRDWRRLHRLVYPAVLLGAVHFVMQAKGWPLEPLVYLGLVLGLLGLRLVPKTRSRPAPGL